ncbi:hypothetical protein HDR66_03310 [bacterium]|nr:hypothetical protein [bacterium]
MPTKINDGVAIGLFGDMAMNKVGILYIALGRYTVFWDEFYESCEKNLLHADKHYFIWTDNPTPAMQGPNITIIPATRRGWPYDTLLRFEMFYGLRDQLSRFDYLFFFNANFKFINPTDLSEIAPREWDGGLMASLHPGREGDVWRDNPDCFPYERRPESTAYVPYGAGRHYVCGAFNGGTADAFLQMCKTLAENIRTDLSKDIVAKVDDESHLNAYLAGRDFLLCGRAYGYPEHKLKHLAPGDAVMVKLISREKNTPKYGGTRWLRGQTDKKIPNNRFSHFMRMITRGVSAVIPVRALRHRIRNLYW